MCKKFLGSVCGLLLALSLLLPGLATPVSAANTPEMLFINAHFEVPVAGSVAISNRAGLEAIKNNLTGTYHLTRDIDLSDAEWVPINDFAGVFDGQGHSINNLYVLDGQYAGLFGAIAPPYDSDGKQIVIKNVGVNIGSQGVTGAYAGGLLGLGLAYETWSLLISNCWATGNVYASDYSQNGRFHAGGLVGTIDTAFGAATIENGYATGDVSISTSQFGSICGGGGLIGFASVSQSTGNLTIKNCYATGNVSVTPSKPNTAASSAPNSSAGGLIGWRRSGYGANTPNIFNCYRLSTQIIVGGAIENASTPLTPEQLKNLDFSASLSQYLIAGTILQLENTSLYISSDATKMANHVTGTYYLWDNKVILGRVRITNQANRVGVKNQVTGWVSLADIFQ